MSKISFSFVTAVNKNIIPVASSYNIGSDNGLSPVQCQPNLEPKLAYCQLDPWEQNSVEFESKYKNVHSTKSILKLCLQNGGHFVQTTLFMLMGSYGVDF